MSTVSEQAEHDLRYVRRAVDRQAAGGLPLSIALLWAVLGLVGFALVDFFPEHAWKFWAVAGPGGFLASAWLGWRAARSEGEQDRAEGRRWLFHWAGLLAAIGLAVLGRVSGAVSDGGLGATILLLLAVAYFTAGVHLVRPLLLVAAILAGGYVAVLFAGSHVWTWVGVTTAAALVVAALAGRGRRGG